VPALANDTTAELGTGGLVFISTDQLRIDSEDLFVSPDEVRVTYQFTNLTDEAQDVLVAFPLPDIKGDGDFMVSIPTEDPTNIFGFETLFEGKPVDATLHQYVFSTNIDYTDYLVDLGIPLAPFGEATVAAIDKLSDEQKVELFRRGLVVPMEFDSTSTGFAASPSKRSRL
jgi:hypothetical protein